MWTYIPTYASNQESDTEITQSLLSINKGDIYKKRIDWVVWKISDDSAKLELFSIALGNLNIKISKLKEWKKNKELMIIINYFLYKVNDSILILEEKSITKENIIEDKEEEEIIKKVYTKSALYQGYIDSYSDKEKTILTWIDTDVYNASIVAWIEEIEAKTIEFRLESSDISNLKSVIETARLSIEWIDIKTIRSNDIEIVSPTVAILKFDKLDWFYIPKQPVEFRLSVTAQKIGFEKVGVFQNVITVKEVKISKAEWLQSKNSVAMKAFNDLKGEEVFQISPALVSAWIVDSLKDTYFPKVNIRADFWRNTQQWSNSELRADIQMLKFNFFESNWSATYKIANTDNSSQTVTWVKHGNFLEFDISTLPKNTISKGKGEDFIIYVSDNTDVTVNLELDRRGIIYSIPWVTWATNITGYIEKWVSLWSRTY
jgi:hypothetical protein